MKALSAFLVVVVLTLSACSISFPISSEKSNEEPSDLSSGLTPRFTFVVFNANGNKEAKSAVSFEKRLATNPNDVELLQQFADFLLNNQQPERSAKLLEHLLKLDPENLQALYQLGRSWQISGKRERALRYFTLFLNLSVRDRTLRQERVKVAKWLEENFGSGTKQFASAIP